VSSLRPYSELIGCCQADPEFAGEVIDDQSWDRVMADRLFGPVRLVSTDIRSERTDAARMATTSPVVDQTTGCDYVTFIDADTGTSAGGTRGLLGP
jgi:CubicO group peptidase (beta-lactamase class C family)